MLEQQRGWHVCAEAGTGREAVELASQHRPDVAIIDIAMPELNGIDATSAIRRESPATEVLIFTMLQSAYLTNAIKAAGARGVIMKDDPDQHVIDAVTALVSILPDHEAPLLAPPVVPALTRRERQVLQLVVDGLTNKEMALRLEVSVKTIETHRATLMRKIGARNASDVVRYAMHDTAFMV